MGFPHLSQPSAPYLELWLLQIFSRKLPAGLRPFSSEINSPRIGIVALFRRPLKSRRNIGGRPFCTQKIQINEF